MFSTTEQEQTSDKYFLESGDKIRFFFEQRAFNADGALRQDKTQSLNKIGHALHDLDPVFDAFSRQAGLAELAQGATFLHTEPSRVLGMWFALENASCENGCLWALPGGHQRGLKSRFVRATGGGVETVTRDDTPWPDDEFVPLEVAKGTLILLDDLLPHGSAANDTGSSRLAYSLHVIDGTCRYLPKNWLQRGRDMPLRGFR